MKPKVKTVGLSLLLVLSIAGFFLSDAYLYYYGRSRFNLFDRSLPGNMAPLFWDGYCPGFIIVGNGGFHEISPFNTYYKNSDTIHLKQVMGYGFDQEKVVAYIKDSTDQYHYITCTPIPVNNSTYRYHYKVLDSINNNSYQWIDLEKEDAKMRRIWKARFFCCLGFIFVIIVALIKSINYLIKFTIRAIKFIISKLTRQNRSHPKIQ